MVVNNNNNNNDDDDDDSDSVCVNIVKAILVQSKQSVSKHPFSPSGLDILKL